MTINISSTLAATLAANDTANNPIIAWDNAANDGTLSTSIGTEVEAAALSATGTTFDAWVAVPNLTPREYALQLVLPSAQSLNFAALAAHNLSDIGATVQLEYSTDSGSTWNDSGAGTVTPTDNQAIAFYFTAVSATHWRFRASTAGIDSIMVGVAVFSTAITIEQRIYQGYAPPITPNQVELQSNVSEGSNLLGAAVTRRGSRASASLTHIAPSFLRGSTWTDFQNHFNNGGGFFWAWRPTKYGDLFYAWRQGNVIAPTNSGPKEFMSFDMEMRFYDQP